MHIELIMYSYISGYYTAPVNSADSSDFMVTLQYHIRTKNTPIKLVSSQSFSSGHHGDIGVSEKSVQRKLGKISSICQEGFIKCGV